MRLLLACAGAASAMEFRVATYSGSKYLDKKADVSVEGTVGDLKIRLAEAFPGQPPASLQRLFYGTKYLDDESAELDSLIDEADQSDRVALLLDMVPPTLDHARAPDDTEDRVRAFVAEQIAIDHLWKSFVSRKSDSEDMVSAGLADEVRAGETALLGALRQRLDERAARVTTGVVVSHDDARGARGLFAKLAAKHAVFLDVDWRESSKIAMGLLFASQVGVQGAFRTALLALAAPLVFLAQTRPARYCFKVFWYSLPRIQSDEEHFLNSIYILFAAPQQVMLSLDEAYYRKALFRPLVATNELGEWQPPKEDAAIEAEIEAFADSLDDSEEEMDDDDDDDDDAREEEDDEDSE
ncbi:hypothetical protein M885DRAFT_551861 [Pelagophyceae sp. CCMP2097]|nr:hypothetical protein M885DRAFT_551861 [Pelagophyceae sp. CCMP2097]